jgi:hypothetical protein
MLLKEMVSMESKGQPAATLIASPLISSQSSNQNCVFRFSPPSHCKVARGGIYSQFLVKTNSWGWRLRWKDARVARWARHMARKWARVVVPLLCLVASPIDFLFSLSLTRVNSANVLDEGLQIGVKATTRDFRSEIGTWGTQIHVSVVEDRYVLLAI